MRDTCIKEGFMDIFDFAIKMEEDGEEYYRELSTKADTIGLKKILNWLARLMQLCQ